MPSFSYKYKARTGWNGCLNLSGLTNMEFLELRSFDLQDDPFVNTATSKLRQLCLIYCHIANVERNFFQKFEKLENLEVHYADYREQHFLPLDHLAQLKNLKILKLITNFSIFKGLDCLKELTSLVDLRLIGHNVYGEGPITEDAFKELKRLEYLKIKAKCGKWMQHLTNLKVLDIICEDLSDSNDLTTTTTDCFSYLTSLEKLLVGGYVPKSGVFKGLNQLKSLCLEFDDE